MNFLTRKIRNSKIIFYTPNQALKLCSLMNRETEILDEIDKLKKTDIFYDIGACEGRFSLYAASKNIASLAFEPEKQNFRILKKNIELNNFKKKIRAFQIAISSSQRNGVLLIGQVWPGGHWKKLKDSKHRPDLEFKIRKTQPVKIYSLDNIIKNKKLPIPRLLKIDADGSEISILQGALNVLKSKELKTIIIEFFISRKTYASNIESMISRLKKLGFLFKYRKKIENNLYNYIFTKQKINRTRN